MRQYCKYWVGKLHSREPKPLVFSTNVFMRDWCNGCLWPCQGYRRSSILLSRSNFLLVVQWIEPLSPKEWMWVRSPLRRPHIIRERVWSSPLIPFRDCWCSVMLCWHQWSTAFQSMCCRTHLVPWRNTHLDTNKDENIIPVVLYDRVFSQKYLCPTGQIGKVISLKRRSFPRSNRGWGTMLL